MALWTVNKTKPNKKFWYKRDLAWTFPHGDDKGFMRDTWRGQKLLRDMWRATKRHTWFVNLWKKTIVDHSPPLPLATLSHPDVNQLLKRKQLTNNLSVHFLRQILLKCVSFWLRMLRYFFVFVNSIFWFYEILFARRLPLQHTISIARAQISILCPKVM